MSTTATLPEIVEYKIYYNNGNGPIWYHYFCKDNLKHGEYTLYYKSGIICEHGFYKEDIRCGEYKSYHENGEPQKHFLYKDDGELNGEAKWYHDNGELCQHCFYKDGGYHGEYKWFRKNGELYSHRFFNNDTEEDLSEYIEDINNITDDEFMNLTMVFGENFWSGK